MQRDDINRPDSAGPTLGDRLQRNLRGVIVALVLTLAAVAVLLGYHAL